MTYPNILQRLTIHQAVDYLGICKVLNSLHAPFYTVAIH